MDLRVSGQISRLLSNIGCKIIVLLRKTYDNMQAFLNEIATTISRLKWI